MKKKFIFYLSIALVMASCYPGGTEYYEDTDVVYTDYDKEFDFSSKGTYSIPDKIVKIEGDLGEGEDPEYVKEPYNKQMLDQIKSNMTALGWTTTRILRMQTWFFFLLSGPIPPFITGITTGAGTIPIIAVGDGAIHLLSSYTTGTLLMTLVADGDDYIEPTRVWTGAINGLLSGAYNTARVNKGIDQAFTQSPYLKTN